MAHFEQWAGFKGKEWVNSVDVRSFIQENYTPYEGDESFLEGPTEATDTLWGKLQELQKEERAKGGVLDMETEVVSGLTAYGPGYISEETKDLEKVVGLQTDKPIKTCHLCHMVVSKWQKNLVVTMVMSQAKDYMKSLQNIQRLITQLFSMLTHQK